MDLALITYNGYYAIKQNQPTKQTVLWFQVTNNKV